jgi:2-polyprenyl-3-methyl-5-hydroxy-6-metoxy-1,4-benzoquinol methylase
MPAAPNRTCLICSGTDLLPVLEIPGVPVLCNRLLAHREEALAVARGDIDLVACRSCGHLFNRAFDPALVGYEGSYDNALHFSGRYQRYATATARRLVRRYDLRGRRIVEIGCGRGDFLRLLCGLGGSRGVGYDPSAQVNPLAQPSTGTESDDVTIIGDIYRAGATQGAHFVCCRHVLEHLLDPVAVLRAVGEDLKRTEGAAFFEVPDASLVLDQLSVWDVIYEHVSYFSRSSLVAAFAQAGLSVRDVQSAFGGQFLWAEAVAGAGANASPASPSPAHHASVASFAERVDRLLSHWRTRIADYRRDGVRLALWGAGSKGVMFLNLLQLNDTDDLPYVVDINPRKTGCHIAGTGQRIIAPSDLRHYQPDVVLVMNPEYRGEIARSLREHEVRARIDLVLPRRSHDGADADPANLSASRIAWA